MSRADGKNKICPGIRLKQPNHSFSRTPRQLKDMNSVSQMQITSL
jgi:hypothetical protein